MRNKLYKNLLPFFTEAFQNLVIFQAPVKGLEYLFTFLGNIKLQKNKPKTKDKSN